MQLPHSKPGENEKDNSHNVTSGSNFSSGASAGPVNEPDFSEFMWMANEDMEEFDRKTISEIVEELGLESEHICGEEEEEEWEKMMKEEEERDTVYFISPEMRHNDSAVGDLSQRMYGMNMSGEIAVQSNLNPHAAEFVPAQSFQNHIGLETPAPVPTLAHQATIAQSHEAPLYSQNCMNNSIHGAVGNPVSPCLHTQNIVLSPNNSHHLNQQRFSTPVRAQINGHNAMRSFYPNVNLPVYLSSVPVYPMMNGSSYVQQAPQDQHQAPPNRYHNPDMDRGNEDEGYGDN